MLNDNQSEQKKHSFFYPRWLWTIGGVLSGIILIAILIYLFESPDAVSPKDPQFAGNYGNYVAYVVFYTLVCAGIPLILPVITGLIHYGAEANARREAEKAKDVQSTLRELNCSFDNTSKTLIVTDRSNKYRTLFEVRKHNVDNYDYIKPSYFYTSATVGGITTGGVSKSGDYYKKMGYTLNCELIWLLSKELVEYIELSGQLLSAARKSKVSKYMCGNKIRVIDEEKHSDSIFAANMGMSDTALKIYIHEKAEAFPSEEKCEEIISWLSNE